LLERRIDQLTAQRGADPLRAAIEALPTAELDRLRALADSNPAAFAQEIARLTDG